MLRISFPILFLLFTVLTFLGTACSSDLCGNDADCTTGKFCVSGKCLSSVPEVIVSNERKEHTVDAGEPTPEKKKEERIPEEQMIEKTMEAKKESIPEFRILDIPAPEKELLVDGNRVQGEPCDPREMAYGRDRCQKGYVCSPIGIYSPSSGAPQPYGRCLKECSQQNTTTCSAGTKCRVVIDTDTGKETNQWVCGKIVEDGTSCPNDSSCKEGSVCASYGNNAYYCQKDCSTLSCPANFECSVISTTNTQKVCKRIRKSKEACSPLNVCPQGDYCAPSGLSSQSSTCRKECQSDSDCDPHQNCLELESSLGITGNKKKVCLQTSKENQLCGQGSACTDANNLCVPISSTMGQCYKKCTTVLDCNSSQTCEAISSSNKQFVCKNVLPPMSVIQSLSTCKTGGIGLRASSSSPTHCAYDCTAKTGTGTDSTQCGKITPGILTSVVTFKGTNSNNRYIVVGQDGFVAKSNVASTTPGAFWFREQLPTLNTVTSLAHSKSGDILVGIEGRKNILLSSDEGITWKTLSVSSNEQLNSLSISSDGKLWILVGTNGTILRSEDQGKNWTNVLTTPATTEELTSVSIGLDENATNATSVVVVVGKKGTILRSVDGGTSFTALAITGLTDHLSFVSISKDATASTNTAFFIGENGTFYISNDKASTFQKEALALTNTLLHGAQTAQSILVVGEKGTLVLHDLTTQKTTLSVVPDPLLPNLYGASSLDKNFLVVGEQGKSFYSSDEGKTWKANNTELSYCAKLNSGKGACLMSCVETNKGKDCPNNYECIKISITGGPTHICSPTLQAIEEGQVGSNSACNPDTNAPSSNRCSGKYTCARINGIYQCIPPTCDPSNALSCGIGIACVYSFALSGYYCGKEVDVDQTCSIPQGDFCKGDSACLYNEKTDEYKCTSLAVKKTNELCLFGSDECETGSLCLPLSARYRGFCAKDCKGNGSCPTGFNCINFSNGMATCLQACAKTTDTCTTKGLTCSLQTNNGSLYCFQ